MGSLVGSSDGHSSGGPRWNLTSAVSFVIAAEQGKQYVSTRKSFSIVNLFTFAEVVSSIPNSEV